MKTLLHKLLCVALLLVAFGPLALRADPPEYATTAFTNIQDVTDDGALYFGVVTALAVVITGFFLGRRWLRRVG